MPDNLVVPESSQTLLAVVLIGYVIGLLLLSIYATGKVKNEEDYLVAGRRLPLFLAWGTLMATWFGAASILGASQAARDEGVIGTILDPFACGVTLIIAGIFFAKPLWKMKLCTMGDFYRQKYGTKAEILASCIQVPGYFGWIAAQYVALAAVQTTFFGIDPKLGLIVAATITMAYTMIGGMWSVTLTDTLQVVIALIGLVILAFVAFGDIGGGSVAAGVARVFNEVDPKKLTLLPSGSSAVVLAWFGIWAVGIFGNIPGQDLQQRVFASNGPNTARWACILAGVLYLIFGMIPIGLGLCSTITHPQPVEGKILMELAKTHFSPVLMVIFIVSVVSIVVSTATSAVLAPAAILGHNLLGRLRLFDGHRLLMERLTVMIVTAGGLAMAFWSDTIFELLEVSLDIAMVGLFVPMIAVMYGRPKGQLSALLAMSFGTIVWLVHYIYTIQVPLPDGMELDYHVYLSTRLYPVERVGSVLNGLVTFWGFVPSDLLGLAASFVGYFTGQVFARTPLEATAQEVAEE
jgi:Na+/proline symporter